MLRMRSFSTKASTAGRRLAGRPACLSAAPLLLLAVPTLFAQARVELEVQSDQPYVGQAITVTVAVINAAQHDPPEFPEMPNCTVRSSGSGMLFSSDVDARTGRAVSVRKDLYNFVLSPQKAGELTIPAIPVTVDGETLKTEPRKLIVRGLPRSPPARTGQADQDNEASDLLLAEITCEQSKLFAGQRAKFKLAIWIKPAEYNRNSLNLSEMLRFLTGSFGPFDTQNFDKYHAKRQLADGSIQAYYVLELPADFILDQPGPLNFDDVIVRIDYPVRFRRMLFGDVQVLQRRRVQVPPTVAVPDVQPLPTEGRPVNFSGAVGQYDLNVIAVPTNVRIGDPIQLVIDISGDPIETIPGPDLASIPELVENFRVPDETLAGTVSGGRKRFTQTIRAKQTDVKEIPPIEFAYFDPRTEAYAVARSEPLPILVSAVEQLDADDLTGITDQPAQRSEMVEARDGLRGNKTREHELLATVRPVTLTQLALTTVTPPLVFICIWGGAALTRSSRNHTARRRHQALRSAERRIAAAAARELPPGELHSEIEAALAGYLADRLNEPSARFVGRAAVAFLQERGVTPELVERYREILERCEHAAYAGASDGDTSLADLARHCARQLERERL
jgi:hypothetical protein